MFSLPDNLPPHFARRVGWGVNVDVSELVDQRFQLRLGKLRSSGKASIDSKGPSIKWPERNHYTVGLACGGWTVDVDLTVLSAGGYFYQIEAGMYRDAKRMMIAR